MEKPIQPLDVWYTSLYAQDEWRPRTNLTVTGGVRMDIAKFGNTAYRQPRGRRADVPRRGRQRRSSTTPARCRRRRRSGRRASASTGTCSATSKTQVRGGTGVFTGKPAYVWISNQIGNTGMLTGFVADATTPTAYPFNPNPDTYKPTTVTGAPAGQRRPGRHRPGLQVPADLADQHRASTSKLPWGLIGTVEFIYNRDVNGMATTSTPTCRRRSRRSPASTTARAGWRTACPACVPTAVGPCVTRINNAPGNQITNAIVLKNQDVGRSWNIAATLAKPLSHGFTVKGAYSYGEARNTIDPGSIASGSFDRQPDRRRSRTTRRSAYSAQLAGPPVLPPGRRTRRSTSASARRRCRSSSRPAPSATPATCSRLTPTATRRRQRPDLHPARTSRR